MEILRSDVKKPNLNIRANNVTFDGNIVYAPGDNVQNIPFVNANTTSNVNVAIAKNSFANPATYYFVTFEVTGFTKTELTGTSETWNSATVAELATGNIQEYNLKFDNTSTHAIADGILYIDASGNCQIQINSAAVAGSYDLLALSYIQRV